MQNLGLNDGEGRSAIIIVVFKATASMSVMTGRLARELRMLSDQCPPGITAWPRDDARMNLIDARIAGPPDTPYAEGVFKLEINVSPRYPFEPPEIRFLTPVYHCNIDSAGRICLDILKMPPKGAWTPSLNLSTMLTSIALLLSSPNPDDGLDPEISSLYKRDPCKYEHNARKWTRDHACDKPAVPITKLKSKTPIPQTKVSDDSSSDCSDEEPFVQQDAKRRRIAND